MSAARRRALWRTAAVVSFLAAIAIAVSTAHTLTGGDRTPTPCTVYIVGAQARQLAGQVREVPPGCARIARRP